MDKNTSLSRRKFISNTAKSGAGALLFPMEIDWLPKPAFPLSEGFKLIVHATNWGFDGTIDAFCAKAKKEGYDGVEVWIPGDQKGMDELVTATSKHDLKFGLLFGGWESDFDTHLKTFEQMMQRALTVKPTYINCHSGRDWFNFEQGKQFIERSYTMAKGTGIPVYHESHRGRLLFAAHVTKQYMDAIPQLRLTFDVSHWCNVHESLLEDQVETLSLVLSKTEHIHARIGHAEGPQVNDPRAPEWKSAVAAHFAWWDKVVERKAAAGQPLTVLTEFGPPTYLPTVPYTFQPLANQWDINVYMMNQLRERYKP
jgi:sugar phosphate isomerase/epimerase